MITDDIVDTTPMELNEHPKLPAILMGELNAEPREILVVAALIDDEGRLDAGANAHVWKDRTIRPPAVLRAATLPAAGALRSSVLTRRLWYMHARFLAPTLSGTSTQCAYAQATQWSH